MNVAVPWPKHSWMFGQLASSHTVTRRFSRSLALRLATALPEGMRTRIHDGLRSTGASANCTGERPILSPPICLTPGCRRADGASACTICRGMERVVVSVMALSAASKPHSQVGQFGGCMQLETELLRQVGQQHRLDRLDARGAAQV